MKSFFGRSIGLAAVTFTMLTMVACGVTSPKYIDYTDGGGATPTPTPSSSAATECATEAATLFESSIQPKIESTCSASGCHSNSVPTLVLQKNEINKNITALFSFMGTNANALTEKFEGTHSGGNLTSTLPQSDIDPWFTKQASCE